MKLVSFFPAIALLLISCTPVQTTAQSTDQTGGIFFKNTVVSLTFDDGDADNYSIRSILAENDLRATFYVVSGFTGKEGYMTQEELRGLYEDGNEIGGHTLDHSKLTELTGIELNKEICEDRNNLLAQGFNAVSFAYPYGAYNEEVKQTVKDCGYNSARTVTEGPDLLFPVDPFELKAMPYIVSDTTFAKMFRYVNNVENDGGGWAVFVFHHVCDGCGKYAVEYDTFLRFAEWLGHQQRENGLIVKTVGEVIGGESKPAVNP